MVDISGVANLRLRHAQVTSVEGLPGELRYPLRGLFTDAEVTLRGTGAVAAGPWLNAGVCSSSDDILSPCPSS